MLKLSASKKRLGNKISTLTAVHLNFVVKSLQRLDLKYVSLETLYPITEHSKISQQSRTTQQGLGDKILCFPAENSSAL